MIRMLYYENPYVPATHRELNKKYAKKEDVLRTDPAKQALFEEAGPHEDNVADYEGLSTGCGLHWPLHILDEFRHNFRSGDLSVDIIDRQSLSKYFGSRAENNATIGAFAAIIQELCQQVDTGAIDDAEYLERHAATFGELCSYETRVNSVLRSTTSRLKDATYNLGEINYSRGLPLCDEVCRLLDSHEYQKRSELVFGLHLLLGSCTAFLWSDPTGVVNQAVCRIQVLRFAREVQGSASELILAAGDEVYNTCVAFHPWITANLGDLVGGLERFHKQSIFDLYSQSPWVCGAQMSFILQFAQDMGFGFLNMRSYFGGILHLYNMLQQCKVHCPELPVIEALCCAFQQEVFMDAKARPTKNFTSIFLRYGGGTLRTKKGTYDPMDYTGVQDSDCRNPTGDDVRLCGSRLSLFSSPFFYDSYGQDRFWETVVNEGEPVRSCRAA
jgi:hypothetical protein